MRRRPAVSPVSPAPSPTAFLAPFPPRIRRVVRELRALIRAEVQDASARVRPGWRLIGFSVPAGRAQKYFCFIAPQTATVRIGFECGRWLDDPRGLLAGSGTQVRYLDLDPQTPLAAPTLRRFIRQAALLASLPRAHLCTPARRRNVRKSLGGAA